VADLSKSAPQFQAAISSARLSFNSTEERRLSGNTDTRKWKTCHSFFLSRSKVDWYWCMQCEFRFRGWAFLLSIKWGIIANQMALSLTCAACIELLSLWWVPPPLTAKFCVTGTLHVWVHLGCPGIWICFYGSVCWKLEIGIDILGIFIGWTLEIGIAAGRHYHRYDAHCWWVCGEGRRRRRWWSRRRRTWRACNYRYECEFYVKGWVAISRVVFKVQFELWYWLRSKWLDGIVIIYILSIWKLAWAKWDKVYQTMVFRYYMR
jgi:hypothetical protein